MALIYHPHVHPPHMAEAGIEFAWLGCLELDSPHLCILTGKRPCGSPPTLGLWLEPIVV
jgi:hypothetical protein